MAVWYLSMAIKFVTNILKSYSLYFIDAKELIQICLFRDRHTRNERNINEMEKEISKVIPDFGCPYILILGFMSTKVVK
jgi:hypothetical protein